MIRIGVIGCGKIAEKHLNAYKKMEGIEIIVSDIVEKGKIIAQNYDVGWQNDPDKLIKSNQIDVIDVCIPTPSHAETILKALDNEKHVFCEKPLAKNFREAEEIKKKAVSCNKVVMVGYLYRFHPAFKFTKDLLQEEIIGNPYYANFRLGGRGSHKAWKHKKETGGGAGNEMLVHMLDLIIWYFSDIKSVKNLYSDVILKEREIEGENVKVNADDIKILKLETEKGINVICESDLITPSYMNYIEIQGTNGSIWASILDYFPTIVYCKEPKGVYDRGNNFFDFPKIDLFRNELDHFIESIKNNKKLEMNSVDDSIKLMKIIDNLK